VERSTWIVLNCGAGEGWRRSIGPIMWKMKCYKKSRMRGISYKQQKEGRLTWLVTSCGGTAFLKHVIEGKVHERTEVTGRRGRRCKLLLDDPQEKRGYCKLKEETPDRTLWITRFGRDYGPVVR
jgi:hypothetical protein